MGLNLKNYEHFLVMDKEKNNLVLSMQLAVYF